MSSLDKSVATQLANIEKRTGKTIEQLGGLLAKSGLEKHGEMVKLLKADLGMGHGDANAVVHAYRAQNESRPPIDHDPLDAIYTGAKAHLRELHEAVMAKIAKLGAFEIAPKKTYLSLRRKKQFAMVGPGTKGRLEIGLNMKGVDGTERIVAQKAGGMCQYKVWLTRKGEIDGELMQWIKLAYRTAE